MHNLTCRRRKGYRASDVVKQDITAGLAINFSCSCEFVWLLDPFSFLQGCSRSRREAVCSFLLVGASVADDAVPAGSRVFASELWCRSLSAFALPPVSRVAGRCPLPFRPARGAEAETPLG
jgi:hypothetical protein